MLNKPKIGETNEDKTEKKKDEENASDAKKRKRRKKRKKEKEGKRYETKSEKIPNELARARQRRTFRASRNSIFVSIFL